MNSINYGVNYGVMDTRWNLLNTKEVRVTRESSRDDSNFLSALHVFQDSIVLVATSLICFMT